MTHNTTRRAHYAPRAHEARQFAPPSKDPPMPTEAERLAALLVDILHDEISHYQGHVNPMTETHRGLHESDAARLAARLIDAGVGFPASERVPDAIRHDAECWVEGCTDPRHDEAERLMTEPEPATERVAALDVERLAEDMHRIESAARHDVLVALRAKVEGLVEEAGGRCVIPGDPEDYICEQHSEILMGDGCEDQPLEYLAVLRLIDAAPEPKEATCAACARGDRDTHAQHVIRGKVAE